MKEKSLRDRLPGNLPEELRRRILTTPHSPSRYRVIDLMPNIPEYYTRFDMKEGDKLYYPENKRVNIWFKVATRLIASLHFRNIEGVGTSLPRPFILVNFTLILI